MNDFIYGRNKRRRFRFLIQPAQIPKLTICATSTPSDIDLAHEFPSRNQTSVAEIKRSHRKELSTQKVCCFK